VIVACKFLLVAVGSLLLLPGKLLYCSLNPTIGKFSGDARHRRRRRIKILQAFGNKADSVKLSTCRI